MDELTIVNRVELQILLAKGTAKLEAALKAYLPPLLLKLSSKNPAVVEKVKDICVHLTTRISNERASLPIEKLISQLHLHMSDPSFYLTSRYEVAYILLGSRYIDDESYGKLFPSLISGISSIPSEATVIALPPSVLSPLEGFPVEFQRYIPFSLLALALASVSKVTPASSANIDLVAHSISHNDLVFVVDAICHILTANAPFVNNQPLRDISPFNWKEYPLDTWVQAKKCCLKLLKSFDADSDLLYAPYLLASVDDYDVVSNEAEPLLKGLSPNFSNDEISGRLLHVFLAPPREFSKHPTKMTVKLLRSFEKFPALASRVDIVKRIGDRGMELGNEKTEIATLQFLRWAIKSTVANGGLDQLASYVVPRLDATARYGNGTPFSLAIECIGECVSNSNTFSSQETVQLFFYRLESADAGNRPGIQRYLGAILDRDLNLATNDDLNNLKKLLTGIFISSQSQQSKYISLRYALRCGTFADSDNKRLALLALDKSNSKEVRETGSIGLDPFQQPDRYGKVESTLPDSTALYNDLMNFWNQLPFSTKVHAIKFIEKIFVLNAVKNTVSPLSDSTQEWEKQFDTALATDPTTRTAVRQYYLNLPVLRNFEATCIDEMLSEEHDEAIAVVLNRTLSFTPVNIKQSLSGDIERILPLMSEHGRFAELAARIVGDIGSSLTDPASFVDELARDDGWYPYAFCVLASRMQQLNMPVSAFIKSRIEELLSSNHLLSPDLFVKCAFECGLYFGDVSRFVKERSQLLSKKDLENAYLVLGVLAVWDKAIVDDLLASETKNIECSFAIGEALSIAAVGKDSQVLERYCETTPNLPSIKDRLGWIIDIIVEKCTATKHTIRQNASIWLLSLVQFCSKETEIKENLPQIQLSFMKLLSDREELVQETAARGLGIVYDLGDSALKEDLVKNLMKSFTSDTAHGVNSGTMSNDTEVFEPGVLNTGDQGSGSVSTYRDILNLATEVGDPSLVYKFMSLARNSAMWSSRKGAAFGLGNIVTKARLSGHYNSNSMLTKKLVIKLYRYRFDPSTSVRQSMTTIWDMLITEKTKTINDYALDILEDLLTSLGSKEWRVRQASALALSDLLQGRLSKYMSQLERIMLMSFRTIDDVKESVRAAGLVLAKTVVGSVIAQLESSGKSSEKILENVIPFLMGIHGIQSDAEDVQSFSLSSILKICKTGGNQLQPYIPSLVEEFLGLLSTLEPQAVNYLALNADKYGLTNSAIDQQRMASLSSSPMMDAIEQMLVILKQDQMENLTRRLAKVIKTSVGMPSKLAAGRVLVTLTMRNLQGITPYADSLMSACQSQLKDRSSTVREAYCIACGYLCRVASPATFLKYLTYLQSLYFDDNISDWKLVAGQGVVAISSHAADTLSHYSSSVLPFVFVAKFDANSEVKKEFQQAWSDNTGGTGVVSLYLPDIIKIAKLHLYSQFWDVRQAIARALAEAAEVASASALTQDNELLHVLMSACDGKSWDGKEVVLRALIVLSGKIKESLLIGDQKALEQVSAIIVREAKRRNPKYQSKAIPLMGKFLSFFPQNNLYEKYFELCDTYFAEDEDAMDEDSEDEDSINKKFNEAVRIEIAESAVDSYHSEDIFHQHMDCVSKIKEYLSFLLNDSNCTWKSRISVCKSAVKLLQSGAPALIIYELWKKEINERCRSDQLEAVRLENAKVAVELAKTESTRVAAMHDIEILKANELSSIVTTELQKGLNK